MKLFFLIRLSLEKNTNAVYALIFSYRRENEKKITLISMLNRASIPH